MNSPSVLPQMQANAEFGGGECKVGMFIVISAQVEVFPPPFVPRETLRDTNGGRPAEGVGEVGADMPRKPRSNPTTKNQAIKPRKESTLTEQKLWSRIRNDQLGVAFHRQHAVGKYIPDFCSPKAKLIIELDGSQHLEQEEYDEERTIFLESQATK